MVGTNNPYTTENTRKHGNTTVGEEMMGGWVTPTVGFSCFLVFSILQRLLSPALASCLHGNCYMPY